jgi:transcriptional regulator GlxA family with amidase domain
MATEVQNQKTIAFVLYPGLTLFDLAGPLQIFAGVSQLDPEYRTVVVGERVEPMDTDLHVKLIPTHSFEEMPHPSVLLVPGNRASTFTAMSNEAIRSYVRSAAETAEVAGSICTGALILASVGLLEGSKQPPTGPTTRSWRSSEPSTSVGGGSRTASSSPLRAYLLGSTWHCIWQRG